MSERRSSVPVPVGKKRVVRLVARRGFLSAEHGLDAAWRHLGHALERTWTEATYQVRAALVARVAKIADVQDHHPEILLTHDAIYFTLNTHDVGGVSMLDVELGRSIDAEIVALKSNA